MEPCNCSGKSDATISVIEYGVVIGHKGVAKDPQRFGSRRDKDRYAAELELIQLEPAFRFHNVKIRDEVESLLD